MSDYIAYRAAWVLPIDGPPRRDAWVAVAEGRIVEVGQGKPFRPGREIDLGDVVIMPGLVNAHTHLELSWLRGRVPPSRSMPLWVRQLLHHRTVGPSDPARIEAAVDEALDEAARTGTVVIGDVSNTLASVPALTRSPISAVVFHEVLGFDASRAVEIARVGAERLASLELPSHVRARLAPHAPYSTSPALFREIAARAANTDWPTTSVHVAESLDEVTLLACGEGAWRELLDDLAIPVHGWEPPQLRPAEYLDRCGIWRPGALAVHGVHLSREELDLLAERDVTVVTCPRSNRWVGAGRPPIEAFVSAGVRVAIGTDSLASVDDLNVFEELRALRHLAPSVPARSILSWATTQGARALGVEQEYGSLAPGRRATLLTVRVTPAVEDVEEALVSGVDAADVAWVDDRMYASA